MLESYCNRRRLSINEAHIEIFKIVQTGFLKEVKTII